MHALNVAIIIICESIAIIQIQEYKLCEIWFFGSNTMLMCQVLETFYFQYHFMPRPRKKKLSNAETDMKDNITFAKELYQPMLMRL